MQMLDKLWLFIDTYVVNTFMDIGFFDVIDILLLAAVLYFVYRFVKERRAGKLLIGLGCLLVLSLVGDLFPMPATRFVFSDLRQLGVIAILIVFQPELRSALEKVGGMPQSGIRNITSDSKDNVRDVLVAAICEAVGDLSRDKVGALIVLERTTKLGDYIHSGSPIDAAVTPHLLRNIFFNKAPLHDGAVIIRGGRISSAGCYLPLTTKEDINKDLGTRHRAAIGLSEVSDAIIIVVSEETGTVSIATDGGLKRNYTTSSLKQELTRLLSSQNQSEYIKIRPQRKNKKTGEADTEE